MFVNGQVNVILFRRFVDGVNAVGQAHGGYHAVANGGVGAAVANLDSAMLQGIFRRRLDNHIVQAEVPAKRGVAEQPEQPKCAGRGRRVRTSRQ